MTPYNAYSDIQGIIYQDNMNKNRLIRTDELHKFSDDTLNQVRTTLIDIATGIQMEYSLKRRWTNQDKRRTRVIINAINRKLRDRRLMRSLEKVCWRKTIRGRPPATSKDHMIHHMMFSSFSSGKSSSSGNLGSDRDTLTVGKISSSGNHITSSGNALAFYSQQSSPKLDTSSVCQVSRIK
ncbi:hypothetical protein Tco_0628477 [Tanacetum coccineum]|uniref:Uncharacterized protein n=1 Tax=Tanacetum coccineum TaxID=301880 RepID=A0ABQ4WQF2_9ASTR